MLFRSYDSIEKLGSEKWKAAWTTIRAKQKDPIYSEQPPTNSQGVVYNGAEGMYTLTAVRAEANGQPKWYDGTRPVKGADGALRPSMLTEDSGRPYSGCRMDVKVQFWVQDNSFGKRIGCELQGGAFQGDGPRFGGGGGTASDEDFEVTGDLVMDMD